MNVTPPSQDHFKGKDALHHIAEVQAKGMLASAEIHGAETPGAFLRLLMQQEKPGLPCYLLDFYLRFSE